MVRQLKRNKIKKGVRKTTQLHFNCFSKQEQKILKRIMADIKFFNISLLKQQAFKLYNQIKIDNEFPENKKTYSSISLLFGLKQQNFRNLVLLGEKMSNNNIKPIGRPSLINDEQKEQLLKKIKEQSKDRNLMGRGDVMQYIESEFKVTPQTSWVDYFVKKHSTEISFVDSKPMEGDRLNITKEIIDKHFENLKIFLAKCDPNLVFNMDETGDQGRSTTRRKRVLIPAKKEIQNNYFREERNESHISYVAAIATDFTSLRPMVITTTKSSCEDIEMYGLPDGKMGLIVGSPSGYMTSELMLIWLNKIFLPEINFRRRGMNNLKATAGLILDGHSSHINEETIELFKKNNVEYFLLPPHSSHLTQPLDRLIFSNFKKYKSKVTFSKEKYTKQSRRILCGLKALAMASTPVDILSSFKRSGIIINNIGSKNIIKINKHKVYKHLPGVDVDSLEEEREETVNQMINKTPRKSTRKKRIKIFFSQKKKKKIAKAKPKAESVLFPTLLGIA